MPTTMFTASALLHPETVDLVITFPNGATIAREGVTRGKVDTPEKLAAWVMDQVAAQPPVEALALRRQFAVTWHTEQVEAAEGTVTRRVVDGIAATARPEDQAWAALIGSGLGTASLEQALATINAAANLEDVRAILRNMARVIVPVRDTLDRLRSRLER